MSANPALPALDLTPDLLEAAAKTKAWPFEEARKIVKRYEKTGFPDVVLFETGYINNEKDYALLRSKKGQEAIADAAARAVRIYFARKRGV
ncbi:MAG: N-acetylmuramoyl-L-alanine amidase [Novosphingobium sp.]